MKSLCKFTFPQDTQRELIEASIASAFFNAECVFGKPRVRISGAAYHIPETSPQCVIDVSTEVGEHIAQVFTGIMLNTLGEASFTVKRIDKEDPVATSGAAPR